MHWWAWCLVGWDTTHISNFWTFYRHTSPKLAWLGVWWACVQGGLWPNYLTYQIAYGGPYHTSFGSPGSRTYSSPVPPPRHTCSRSSTLCIWSYLCIGWHNGIWANKHVRAQNLLGHRLGLPI